MIVVYIPIHIASGLPVNENTLFVIPILALFLFMAAGLAMLVAAAQVYFRDLSNFLPYMLRIWLYVSPVLYFAENVPKKYEWLLDVNPLGPLLTAWSDALFGIRPDATALLGALAWGIGIFLAAGLFFLSREREFAVRL
jgi:teichoic acid transport system permease protein